MTFLPLLITSAALLLSGATTPPTPAGSLSPTGKQAPPAAVHAAFAQRYAAATGVKWEPEGAAWEAGFHLGKEELSAVFSAAGVFQEVEREVALTALPAPVLPYLRQHYAGQKVKEAARIEDAAGAVTWEAEVAGKDVLFDATGKFLREAKD